MPRIRTIVGTLLVLSGAGGACSFGAHDDSDSVLDTLVREHPRLMLKEDALQDLKKKTESDETLQRSVDATIKQADARLDDRKATSQNRSSEIDESHVQNIVDTLKEWKAAAYRHNLKFGVSTHLYWSPRFFKDARAYQKPGTLTWQLFSFKDGNADRSAFTYNLERGSSGEIQPEPWMWATDLSGGWFYRKGAVNPILNRISVSQPRMASSMPSFWPSRRKTSSSKPSPPGALSTVRLRG